MHASCSAQMPDAVFTGSLSRQAVAEVFASADAFVFPSRTDTAGNVVLEAQASGLPVVVTDAGGPCESMVDGSTGIVCQTTDPDAWAEAITRMMSPESRTACSSAARAYALERQWPHALEPLYRAYRDAFVLHAAAPPRGIVPVSSPFKLTGQQSITAFFLYDVAESIDLAAVTRLVSATVPVLMAPKPQTPSYIAFKPPPISIDGRTAQHAGCRRIHGAVQAVRLRRHLGGVDPSQFRLPGTRLLAEGLARRTIAPASRRVPSDAAARSLNVCRRR